MSIASYLADNREDEEEETSSFGCASIHARNISSSDLKLEQQRHQNLKFLELTEDDLVHVPIMKDVIDKVNGMSPEFNRKGSADVSFSEWKEYQINMAEKTKEQYHDFEYYVIDDTENNQWHMGTDEESYDSIKELFVTFPDMYAPSFSEGWVSHNLQYPPIRYGSTTYHFGDGVFLSFMEGFAQNPQITIVLSNDQESEKAVVLSDGDMREEFPKVLEAIQKIGTVEESLFANMPIADSEQSAYRAWLDEKIKERFGDDDNKVLIKYNERYYSIGFSIC